MAKKILILAANYWTSPFQVGSHHYAKVFSKNGWEVFFMSEPITPFHFLSKDISSVRDRWDIYTGKIKISNYNIKTYLPFSLFSPNEKFFFNTEFVANLWQKFTFPNVLNVLRKNNFLNVDVIWFDSIIFSFLIDIVSYKKSIFRIADRFDAFKKINTNIKKQENKLKKQIDFIIYTAKTLEDYIGNYKYKSFYIPNGVDFDFFNNSSSDIPYDLFSIPKPRAIYVGAIDEWFDTDFLISVAKKSKDFSFIIIGQPKIDLTAFESVKNIYFLGRKNYSLIPSYLKNCDVGIITFKKNHPVVKSVNPVKLYEYMACGLPVVSIKWDELEVMNSPAVLVDNEDDFIKNLYYLVEKKDENKYISFAKKNTWDKRYGKILEILNLKS